MIRGREGGDGRREGEERREGGVGQEEGEGGRGVYTKFSDVVYAPVVITLVLSDTLLQ